MLAHRLNDNELTFQYPAKTLLFTEHRCFFQNIPPPPCRLNGRERRLCSLREERSRNNALFEAKLLFFFFLFLRLPSPPTQLIHPPHFLAYLHCSRPIFNDPISLRKRWGGKEWRMAKQGEEEIDNGGGRQRQAYVISTLLISPGVLGHSHLSSFRLASRGLCLIIIAKPCSDYFKWFNIYLKLTFAKFTASENLCSCRQSNGEISN